MNKTNIRAERIGEKNTNNQNCPMEIIEYKNNHDITVMFDNNPQHVKYNVTYSDFKRGLIKNPFVPTVYGVGILGNECPIASNGKMCKEYWAWKGMLQRCYTKKRSKSNIAYANCKVSDDFLYYPNFYRWITSEENYLVWKNTPEFSLDKDILGEGKNIYSKETCCLVPYWINQMVKKNPKTRGECLIGVFKIGDKYSAQCLDSFTHKAIRFGTFDNEHDAFLKYKEYKEALVKKVAEMEYAKGTISKKCKDALCNFVVNEND